MIGLCPGIAMAIRILLRTLELVGIPRLDLHLSEAVDDARISLIQLRSLNQLAMFAESFRSRQAALARSRPDGQLSLLGIFSIAQSLFLLFRSPLGNKIAQTFCISESFRRQIRVCLVRVLDEGLSRLGGRRRSSALPFPPQGRKNHIREQTKLCDTLTTRALADDEDQRGQAEMLTRL